MSQNKTQQTTASVNDFLAAIVDPVKQADSFRIRDIMEDVAGEPAVMWGPSIIGCGVDHYRYESGREGTQPRIAFSPRARAITLYVMCEPGAELPALQRLGTFTTSKACVYVKRLADIDETALRDLFQDVWEMTAPESGSGA